jgi:hypothetical protein
MPRNITKVEYAILLTLAKWSYIVLLTSAKRKGDRGMSKYTEYREIAGKMKTIFEERSDFEREIGRLDNRVIILLDPLADTLGITIQETRTAHQVEIKGQSGLALFKALKQIYE